MKANELRIGSIIRVTFSEDEIGFGKDHNGIIEAIQKSKVIVSGGLHWHPIEAIEPIPLTPSVLEAVGFKRDKDGWIISYEYKIYDPIIRGGSGGLVQNDIKRICIIHRGYVMPNTYGFLHELQNAVYYLTGTELEIDLNKLK